jgi:hypothetical protein
MAAPCGNAEAQPSSDPKGSAYDGKHPGQQHGIYLSRGDVVAGPTFDRVVSAEFTQKGPVRGRSPAANPRTRPPPKAEGAVRLGDESPRSGRVCSAVFAQKWACSEWVCLDGDRRLRKVSLLPDGRAVRLPGGSPPSVQNEVATRGVRALVRSGIRSDGERSLFDAPVQFGAKAPCTEALALRGAAGWYLPAARGKGSVRGDSRWVLEVLDALTVVLADGLDCRNRSATFGSYAPR